MHMFHDTLVSFAERRVISMDKWKTTCSQALLDTKWVKVRKDAVDLPNGQHIDDFYAITINEVAIVALDDDGNIILKKEYRHCYGRDLIEIPAGGFERGEEGLEVAKRELLEETGYTTLVPAPWY